MRTRSPEEVYQLLRPRMLEELPGHAAHVRMAPFHRRDTSVHSVYDKDCRQAGVLALLDLSSTPSIVLTQRTNGLNNHGGQISFPGGSCELGETHIQAAMRETCEEVGAAPSSYVLAGALTPLYIPPSNFCVHPYLGIVINAVAWTRDETEVESIIHAPVASMTDTSNVRETIMSIRKMNVKVPLYQVGSHEVWGATAMMLSEILDILVAAEIV